MSPRHRDAFGRVSHVDQKRVGYEHYLRPSDGRLRRLRVQGTDDAIGYGQKNWERTGRARSRISAIMHLTHWTYSSVLVEGTERRRYTSSTVFPLLLKWIPSCLILVLLLVVPQNLEGVFKNGGFYDPVQYHDWRYPKVSRNRKEGEHEMVIDHSNENWENKPLLGGEIEMENITSQTSAVLQVDDGDMDEGFDDLPAQHFRPRYLCFLQDGPRGPDTEYETCKVTDWIKQNADYSATDFVFLSYTRKHFLISPEQKWRGKPEPDEATKAAYCQQADADRTMLLAYGMEAARSAKKRAFWVDFECIRDADNVARGTSQSDDVFRICDIVRAAHSLVILVGTPHDTRVPGEAQQYAYDAASMDEWLREWGTRLWTLPEMLLCSPERRVKLYAVGGPNPPEEIAKRNIAARSVWPDAKLVRQLVDHYESSVHLTPLELVSIALECFSWRHTDQFNNGDMSYALMGLLRRRPAVVKSDKSFEAFARLSLANDSDKLLERLICMQPTRRNAPWHKISDAWGVKLWDVEPHCQVAGIVDDQTITLDGAFGATIQWDALEQVAFLKRPTISRKFGKILLRGVPAYLATGLAFTISWGAVTGMNNGQDSQNGNIGFPSLDPPSSGSSVSITSIFLIAGLIILVPSAIITLLAPVMLLNIYQGKFWSTQAHFLGLQGIPDDIGEIERSLFGFNHGRLRWSVAGSTLSRNGRSKDGERIGLPPHKVNQADRHGDNKVGETNHEEETVFTLIDTYAMTATAFRATRPPTTVIVCGHEGGMQRAILCSYDWRDGTFIREAVIRVKTLVLDRMFRVDRFRFALGHREDDTSKYIVDAANAADAAHIGKKDEVDKFWARWREDLALLPFMWFVCGVHLYSTSTRKDIGSNYLAAELSAVGFLLVQPLNYILFRKCHMGYLVGSASLIKGILAIIYQFIHAKPGLLSIHIFYGISNGILIPAFVYLTGLWYDGGWGRMLRIVIWASGTVFFPSLPLGINGGKLGSGSGIHILPIIWASIGILLSGYAFSALGTPEQAAWLWDSRNHAFLDASPHDRTNALPQIYPLLKRVHTYFFVGTFLLLGAFATFENNHVGDFYLPGVTLLFVFPFLFVLILGALVAIFSHSQLATIIVLISISFAGWVTPSSDSGVDNLLLSFRSLSYYAVFLVWALLLTDMVEPQAFLGTLCIAFVGYGLGRVITGAYLASEKSGAPISRANVPKNAITAFYALSLIVLLSWSAYRWWSKRRDRGHTVTPVHVYHQQTEEPSFDHIESGYSSQMALIAPGPR